MLFMRGNAMSGAPIISGTNQLPKPPIIAGITGKNTMISPCAVSTTLESGKVWKEVRDARMRQVGEHAERYPADTPAPSAKIRYIVPMSLWLVENSESSPTCRMGWRMHGFRRCGGAIKGKCGHRVLGVSEAAVRQNLRNHRGAVAAGFLIWIKNGSTKEWLTGVRRIPRPRTRRVGIAHA